MGIGVGNRKGRQGGHRSGKQRGETRLASEWETERGDKAGIGVGNREGRQGGHRSGKQRVEIRRASEWDTERGDKVIAVPSGARIGVHTLIFRSIGIVGKRCTYISRLLKYLECQFNLAFLWMGSVSGWA